jgi:hypothetical protein
MGRVPRQMVSVQLVTTVQGQNGTAAQMTASAQRVSTALRGRKPSLPVSRERIMTARGRRTALRAQLGTGVTRQILSQLLSARKGTTAQSLRMRRRRARQVASTTRLGSRV